MRINSLRVAGVCLALSCIAVMLIFACALLGHGKASAAGKRGTAASAVENSPDAYRIAEGPLQVKEADVDLRDAARNKALPVRIYWPDSADHAPYPVIVFSHGLGGARDVAPALL